MFTGTHTNSIDEKGRVVIPVKLRYGLGERVWLSKGPDGCLNIFTQDGWSEYKSAYVTNRTLKDENARKLQRFIFGGAHELDIDQRQGRINLPQDLIDYAGIGKEVVFVGAESYIELWDPAAYEKEMGPDNLNPKRIMADAGEMEE